MYSFTCYAAGEDYEALNMTLLFATSSTPEVCVNITILYDNVPEGDEGFFLDLRSGDTAVVINSGGETSFVNILDDDGKYYPCTSKGYMYIRKERQRTFFVIVSSMDHHRQH